MKSPDHSKPPLAAFQPRFARRTVRRPSGHQRSRSIILLQWRSGSNPSAKKLDHGAARSPIGEPWGRLPARSRAHRRAGMISAGYQTDSADENALASGPLPAAGEKVAGASEGGEQGTQRRQVRHKEEVPRGERGGSLVTTHTCNDHRCRRASASKGGAEGGGAQKGSSSVSPSSSPVMTPARGRERITRNHPRSPPFALDRR